MSVGQQLHEHAIVFARAKHHENGGTGEAPDALVRHFEDELSRDAARLGDKHTMSETTFEPGTRRAPGMTPTNGLHPDDARNAARPVSELRTVRGLDGREHRVLNSAQKLSDYTPTAAPFGADVFGAALAAYATGKADQYRAELRALGGSTNYLGGFLVPSEIGSQVIDLARSKARLLQAGAMTMAMEAESVSFAKVLTDPAIYQVGENVAITPSDVTFGACALHAKKLAGLVKCSRELVEDASNVGSLLVDLLTTSMANALDTRILVGEDSFAGLVEDSSIGETAGIAGNLDYDKVLTAMNAVRLLDGNPATLIAHPNFYHELSILKESTTDAYLQPPAAWADLTKLDTTAITSSVGLLGDFSKLWIGLRGDIQVEITDVAGDSFANHQVWFKVTLRCASVLTQAHMHRLAGITY